MSFASPAMPDRFKCVFITQTKNIKREKTAIMVANTYRGPVISTIRNYQFYVFPQ